MDISDIEELVSIVRDARISELTVSSGSTTVRLRKQIPHGTALAPSQPPVLNKESGSVQADEPTDEPSSAYISAPMVGIFHIAEGLTSPGATVKAGQVVGAIESMKLMNDVVSQYDGVVAEVLVEDGAPVEYGQNLFRIELRSSG
jgi:acetyl-CoA carboxylase biotin carboxyl carrier protein